MSKTAPIETAIIERAERFDATIFLGTGRYRTESFANLADARAAAARFAEEAANGRKGMVYAIDAGRSVFVPDAYTPTPSPTTEDQETIMGTTKTPAEFTGTHIAQLCAVITGGGFKRANSKATALARFEKLAAERGIGTERILASGDFDQAKAVLVEALKGKPARVDDRPAPAAKAEMVAKPAAEAKTAKAAGGKRAAILEAAQRGEIPAAPDFSANTHKPFRKKLEAVVALVEAGDIEGLRSFAINPVSSSPKAIDKYRNLAVIALEARAASKAAA